MLIYKNILAKILKRYQCSKFIPKYKIEINKIRWEHKIWKKSALKEREP